MAIASIRRALEITANARCVNYMRKSANRVVDACRSYRTLVVGLGNATYNSVEFRDSPPRREASSTGSSGLEFG
jgi:hypothetical protein